MPENTVIEVPKKQEETLPRANPMPEAISPAGGIAPHSPFPAETVDLPSQGYFYLPENPLSSGQVDIKEMTAREEDILTSQNLIRRGVVLDKLLKALIVTPGVNMDDILIGDKNALFVAARVFAYGNEYPIRPRCPQCGAQPSTPIIIDLLQFGSKDVDLSKYERGVNNFDYQFPNCKKNITYKILTHLDETNIDKEIKAMARFSKGEGSSSEITTRLKYTIQSVEGNTDKAVIKQFVDTLSSKDSLAFRQHLRETMPDLDTNFNFVCEECNYEERMMMPIGIDFFWPETRG